MPMSIASSYGGVPISCRRSGADVRPEPEEVAPDEAADGARWKAALEQLRRQMRPQIPRLHSGARLRRIEVMLRKPPHPIELAGPEALHDALVGPVHDAIVRLAPVGADPHGAGAGDMEDVVRDVVQRRARAGRGQHERTDHDADVSAAV